MSPRLYILACVVLMAALSSCVDQRAVTPQAMELRLTDVAGIVPPTIPLSPASLNTQEEFDAFEKNQLDRMSPGDLIPILENLAADAKPAERPQDVILLQRLALLHLRSGQGGARLQKAFAVADRLRQEVGTSPHKAVDLHLLDRIQTAKVQVQVQARKLPVDKHFGPSPLGPVWGDELNRAEGLRREW
ncbi:MAG: hypothetical protein VX938_13920, partial [Myxococcota bacterium]|nr:hypothetical protein [Myxococcota bacterium]